MSHSEELIHALARNLQPVRPIPALHTVAGLAALAAASTGLAWLAVYGWGQAGGGLLSAAVATALVAIGGGALLWGLAASVPGRHAASRAGLALLTLGAAPVLIGATFALSTAGAPTTSSLLDGLFCLASAALIAVPSAVLSARFVLRAAPTHLPAALAAVCVGSAALGAIGMHLACPVAERTHLLGAHALAPLGAGTLVLALVFGVRPLLRAS